VRTIPAKDASDRRGGGSDDVDQELAHDNPRRRRESSAEREADDGHASGTSRSLLRHGTKENS
jgi:hypothetical protein